MNKLKILIANRTGGLFEYSISSIKPFVDDISKENIIIVPDKLSLLTEQTIFSALNIDAYFNISVMGISKFANKIIKENNLQFLECTAIESKLIVLNAIQNVKEGFKCFSKNYTLGFVDEIYAKIEQIKSSNAKIEDLIDENATLGTKLKFEDIKLIYCEYQKLLAGKIDSGELINLFNSVAIKSEFLKNCNVFFVGFDSLTKQGLQLLKNIAKNANYSQIAVVAPNNQNNYRIYDQTFLDSIINMCKQEQIECETVWNNFPLENTNKNIILNNLFSRKNKYDFENEYFNIYKSNSFSEEIEICVKQINYLLKTNNLKFNDIAVCAPVQYHKILNSKLSNLNIDVFCDSTINLLELEVVKYLFNIFKFAATNDNKILNYIFANDFCDLDKIQQEQILTLIIKYGKLESLKKYAKIEDEKTINYFNFLENIKIPKNSDVSQYINIFKHIIENTKIKEKIVKKCDFFEKKGHILLHKTYLQIEDKLSDCLNAIENCIKNNVNYDDFLKILEKVLTECEISAVPSGINQIFIGDTKSFYGNKKYIFILGMNEGILPICISDLGLISDKEICSETIKVNLEPTTQIINKRNKFKLFEILLSAKTKCFLSYHVYSSDSRPAQPNEFVSELKYLFENKEISSASLKIVDEIENEQKLINKLCFNLQDEYNASLQLNDVLLHNFRAIIKNAITFKQNINLFNYSDLKINFSKLFFKDGKASISIIEKYNGCPKSAFLANALKLQKQQKEKIEANIIGTFIHEVGEVFVKHNLNKLGNLSEAYIEKNVQEIIEQILKNEQYFALLLKENKFLLKLLKKEGLRFCNFINYEQKISFFKPKYAEKYFGGETGFKPLEIEVEGEKYKISGFVDRIDVAEDSFRIIDYKTGNASNSKGAEQLYYGTKIQLFIYAKAVACNMNKKLFGAFYLPIKNGFNKDGESAYKFSGFLENNASLAMLADNTLLQNGKSEVLNVSLAKIKNDGEITLRKKQNILPYQVLMSYCSYAQELVKKSISDIKSGYVECSPIEQRCKICEFNKICKFAFNEKVVRTEKYNVIPEKFLEIQNGN
ncbi:MAG: hypothetical protein E7376_02115 [Clostridiales bacterium]|nr:hypothetical protein [Clostridiales bacterium]